MTNNVEYDGKTIEVVEVSKSISNNQVSNKGVSSRKSKKLSISHKNFLEDENEAYSSIEQEATHTKQQPPDHLKVFSSSMNHDEED
jgi:hypothetical protein